jgi:hypothetical protein
VQAKRLERERVHLGRARRNPHRYRAFVDIDPNLADASLTGGRRNTKRKQQKETQ